MSDQDHYGILPKPHMPNIVPTVADISGMLAKAQIASAAAHKRNTQIPPWAFDEHQRQLTDVGLLWIRLNFHQKSEPASKIGSEYYFQVGKVSFCHVVRIRSKVVTFVTVNNEKALLLEDDADLFPSDALITKILTLRG